MLIYLPMIYPIYKHHVVTKRGGAYFRPSTPVTHTVKRKDSVRLPLAPYTLLTPLHSAFTSYLSLIFFPHISPTPLPPHYPCPTQNPHISSLIAPPFTSLNTPYTLPNPFNNPSLRPCPFPSSPFSPIPIS